jgi:hypothetical protein
VGAEVIASASHMRLLEAAVELQPRSGFVFQSHRPL